MDDDRESRRQLELVSKELEQNDTARRVQAQYMHVISAAIEASNQLWEMREDRFAAAMESRVVDIEIAARRHLQSIRDRDGKP